MASLDDCANDAAGVRPEVEQWLRRGATMVQELTTHVLAAAAMSTERERADLVRALDALQARLDAHVAAQPMWRRQ
jgi:DNA/RNA-binding domain of Phe-tRNA-synthetase-like protein